MSGHAIKLFDEPVRKFLAGVDLVLNSNTFILQFPVLHHDVVSSFEAFLATPDFQSQLLQQDRDRDWYNFDLYDPETESYRVRAGLLVKESHILKATPVKEGRLQYLIAMLTGDTTKGPFFSFYGKQKQEKEAAEIAAGLIQHLFNDRPWELLILEPDFLWSEAERHLTNEIYYFAGEGGNDSATVLASEDEGYLILTNGID
ncbi:MAG TPA: hypothetical protein VF490_21080 [Chryseosolibacter sp.]